MRNRMYGGVRGRKMKVGGKLLHFPPTRSIPLYIGIPSDFWGMWEHLDCEATLSKREPTPRSEKRLTGIIP